MISTNAYITAINKLSITLKTLSQRIDKFEHKEEDLPVQNGTKITHDLQEDLDSATQRLDYVEKCLRDIGKGMDGTKEELKSMKKQSNTPSDEGSIQKQNILQERVKIVEDALQKLSKRLDTKELDKSPSKEVMEKENRVNDRLATLENNMQTLLKRLSERDMDIMNKIEGIESRQTSFDNPLAQESQENRNEDILKNLSISAQDKESDWSIAGVDKNTQKRRLASRKKN